MKMRRVLALVMAVLMVIGLMPVVSAGDVTPPTDVQQGKVTFTKDLRRDANRQPVVDEKGWYTVDISVSGVPYTVTEKTAADVVLIVDNSGSMAEETGHACDSTSFTKETYYDSWVIFELNPKTRYVCDSCGREYYDHKPPQKCRGTITRIDAAKEVSKIFADDILDNTGNKMAVIGFSSGDFSSSAIDSYQPLTSVKSDVSKAIDEMSADGGTDYTAAFKKGMGELLNEDGTLKNNRPAYVIFISDGAPGLYRDEPKLDDPNWNGSAQITALKAAGVKIYTIGIKLDGKADDYMSKIATDIKHYVNVQTKNYDSEMEKVLVEWAEHINTVNAGKDAKVIDVVNTEDFYVDMTGLVGATYDDKTGTITWDLGDITEAAQIISFKVKPKNGLTSGSHDTNESCTLSYTDGSTNQTVNRDAISPYLDIVTVTFDSVGGSAVDSQSMVKGNKATKPADPTKDGYDFIGWTKGTEAFDFNSVVNEDIILVANWKAKEIEPEIPEPPTEYEFPMVIVKCTNDEAEHSEQSYVIRTDEYTALNEGNVIDDNGTYKYEIELNLDKYLDKYNVDVADGHTLAEGNNAKVTFVKDDLKWASSNVTVYVKCETEPKTPAAPEWLGMVTVKCVNGEAGHEEKAYEINAGDYTVLNGGVTEVNGEYQYVINLINARYLSAYNADTGAEHTLKENKATEIKFVYEKETGRWIHENPIIEVICKDMPHYYSAKIVSINLLSATAEKPYDGKPLTKDEFESLEIKVRFTNIENSEDTYVRSYFLKDVTITPVAGQERTYRISLKLDDNRSWQIDVKFTGSQTQVGFSDNTYGIVGFIENDDTNSGVIDYLNRITTFNYGKLTVTSKDTPIDPPFIVLFPTLEISNKVIAPKNFEKTSFEYDIINVKTGDVEKSVTLKADSSVRVMVTGGTEYMVVPKNLEVPGYIVTTTSTPDSATVTSDKIGNVSVDFTHIYVVGLNTEDHYAYIRGYEDGTIRPEGNITRAEVATIFYRLLSSEALEAFKTTENTFTDVDSDAWYNLSVSTLAKAGVISGYPDGSFNPNGKITRAELVSIATRFFTTIEVGDSKFSDIAGHWAAKAIDEAYIKGIIKGYSDGTFRPDQAVTRAEAMKIVNGILGRPIDTCVLIEGIKLWPDVASDAWYYYVVAEATNAHRYELTTPEKWTAIIIDEIEY